MGFSIRPSHSKTKQKSTVQEESLTKMISFVIMVTWLIPSVDEPQEVCTWLQVNKHHQQEQRVQILGRRLSSSLPYASHVSAQRNHTATSVFSHLYLLRPLSCGDREAHVFAHDLWDTSGSRIHIAAEEYESLFSNHRPDYQSSSEGLTQTLRSPLRRTHFGQRTSPTKDLDFFWQESYSWFIEEEVVR